MEKKENRHQKVFNQAAYVIETKYKCSMKDLYNKVGKDRYDEIVGAYYKTIKYGN